jgi:protein involved in polysaccharide export with SLBB domain
MRQFLLSLVLALAVTPAAAQKQTAEPAATKQTTRSRVIGPKVENHADSADVSARQVAGQPSSLIQKTMMTSPAPVASAIMAPPRAEVSSMPLSAPAATLTVYRVGVGDVLDIRLATMPTRESTLFTVLRNGTIEFPLVSYPLTVSGMTTDEISQLMRKEIKVISGPRVTVGVRDYASHGVVVTGLVDNPGRKFLRREAMPLYAVIAEALPRPEAAVATITRNGSTSALSLTDNRTMATAVLTGDTIKISGTTTTAAKRFLYIGGDVASAGEREFRDGMTLTQAVMTAGGVPRDANSRVKVSRRGANGFLVVNEYNLRSIKEGKSPDPLIEAGDRIEVTRIM